MRLGFFLVFAALPILELALLVKLGQEIGFWWTMALIVATAMTGAFVIHRQSLSTLQRAMNDMQQGSPPLGPVMDGAFLVVAGVLMVTPGLISDCIGLALLVPPMRHWIAARILNSIMNSPGVRIVVFGEESYRVSERDDPRADRGRDARRRSDGEVIEGEFERLDERTIDAEKNKDRGKNSGR